MKHKRLLCTVSTWTMLFLWSFMFHWCHNQNPDTVFFLNSPCFNSTQPLILLTSNVNMGKVWLHGLTVRPCLPLICSFWLFVVMLFTVNVFILNVRSTKAHYSTLLKSRHEHWQQNSFFFGCFWQKKSREETCGEGSGVEILENKPYTDGPGGTGQYTHKVYHIGMHIPSWFRSILPKAALRVEEESWNAYPYTRTRWASQQTNGTLCVSNMLQPQLLHTL